MNIEILLGIRTEGLAHLFTIAAGASNRSGVIGLAHQHKSIRKMT